MVSMVCERNVCSYVALSGLLLFDARDPGTGALSVVGR
jgi:hypothetical protein